MKTKYDMNAFVRLFRANSEKMDGTTRASLKFCLNKLYNGDLEFRDVIVNGFMYSRDYAFLLDLSLPEYDDFNKLKNKIDEIRSLL